MAELTETKRHLLGTLSTALDSEYKFQVVYGEGKIVVQRIRVELSRIKEAYARNNRRLKAMGESIIPMQPFKLHASVTPFMENETQNGYDEIVLIRSQTSEQVQSRAMGKLMQAIANGSQKEAS